MKQTSRNSKKRGRYKSILERPEIVASQGRMGDLEMDLILGATPNEAILTIVDRKTDYIFIELLPQGRKSKPLARVVNRRLAFLKRRGQLHSITTDNGTEFSAYRSIERSLGVPVSLRAPTAQRTSHISSTPMLWSVNTCPSTARLRAWRRRRLRRLSGVSIIVQERSWGTALHTRFSI